LSPKIYASLSIDDVIMTSSKMPLSEKVEMIRKNRTVVEKIT